MRRAIALPLVLAAFVQTSGAPVAATDRRCPPLGDDQILIPSGETVIGTDKGYADEGPAYVARIRAFRIDRHEVTNRQFAQFVAATGHVTTAERRGESIVFEPPPAGAVPVHPSQWWKLVARADWRHPEGPESNLEGRDDLPVVHVAYEDARAYARWKGRALPTEEQFEYAARAGAAQSLAQPSPRQANSWQGAFPTTNARSDGYAGLAPVGCFDANAFGLSDMIGNAWEWTASWYLPSHGALPDPGSAPGNPSFDPSQPDARTRVIKGGSFLCAPNYCARYRPEARHAQDEMTGTSHIGFRTVEPIA